MDEDRHQPSTPADREPPPHGSSVPSEANEVEPHPQTGAPSDTSAPVNELRDFVSAAVRHARKVVVAVVGVSVVLLGLALLVLPGPAFVVIPAGLAILATEFVWARRLLRKVRDRAQKEFRALWSGGSSEDSEGDKPPSESP